MSHAYGQVRFQDGLIMHFEYDGTSGHCISNLRDTHQQVSDNWRKSESLECLCGRDEPVKIATDYGPGLNSDGRACRHCRAITKDPLCSWENASRAYSRGEPDWWLKTWLKAVRNA